MPTQRKRPAPGSRTRISLETTADFKTKVLRHGKQLRERSIIGTLRESVRRSAILHKAQAEGYKILVVRSGITKELDLSPEP